MCRSGQGSARSPTGHRKSAPFDDCSACRPYDSGLRACERARHPPIVSNGRWNARRAVEAPDLPATVSAGSQVLRSSHAGRTDPDRRWLNSSSLSNVAVHPIRSAVVHLPSQTGPPPALRSASFTTLSNPFSTARAILAVGSRSSSLCRFRAALRAASGSCGFHWIGFGACEYRREEVLVRASGYGVWWYDREARFLVRAGEDERSETVRSTTAEEGGVSAIDGAAERGKGKQPHGVL